MTCNTGYNNELEKEVLFLKLFMNRRLRYASSSAFFPSSSLHVVFSAPPPP